MENSGQHTNFSCIFLHLRAEGAESNLGFSRQHPHHRRLRWRCVKARQGLKCSHARIETFTFSGWTRMIAGAPHAPERFSRPRRSYPVEHGTTSSASNAGNAFLHILRHVKGSRKGGQKLEISPGVASTCWIRPTFTTGPMETSTARAVKRWPLGSWMSTRQPSLWWKQPLSGTKEPSAFQPWNK